jgi:hypothetical protein
MTSACSNLNSTAPEWVNGNWLAFGAEVFSATNGDRSTLYIGALTDHETNPTSDSAIRLAIVTVSLEGIDHNLASVLSLIDYAESNMVRPDDTAADFIRFFRPIVQRLAAQRAALISEIEKTGMLEEQLDALKEIEERLNESDVRR